MTTSRKYLFSISLLILWAVIPCLPGVSGSNFAALHAQQSVTKAPAGTTAYYELNIRDCFKKSRWKEGKTLLDEAIEKYPQMSAFNELMGKYLVHQAQLEARDSTRNTAADTYDKARYYLIRAINIDEKNVNARYLMLQVETETRNYSSAIVYCNDLLEENPYNEDLWRKKIDLYRQLGNNAEADRLLERLYTIYPGDDTLRKDVIYRKVEQAKKQREHGDIYSQEQSLRQLLSLQPNTADHYRDLANLLHRTGRISEAAEVAGQGASVCGSTDLVLKRASMLAELNRHREAIEYLRSVSRKNNSPLISKALIDLEEEEARIAQYNDAYIAYAKIYDTHHSPTVLDYLIATSMERWYLDDALMYINESIRRRGETPKMLFNLYTVQKRLGNTRRANAILEDAYAKYPEYEEFKEAKMLLLLDTSKELMDQQLYGEAIPKLEEICRSNPYPYILEAAIPRLFTCYCQTRQYAKAEPLIAGMEPSRRITQTATLYNAWGKPRQALDYLVKAYTDNPDSLTRSSIAGAYEEIAIPYIKSLLANGRTKEAVRQVDEALSICPASNDIMRYGITAAQRSKDYAKAAQYIVQARSLYPDDPYFVLKHAQLKHFDGKYQEALDELTPLLLEHAGDTLLMALYSEISIEIARQYIRDEQPDEALKVLQSAIDISPDNTELYLYQSIVYEKKKEWDKALESYMLYKPGLVESSAYRHHIEEISHHLLRNRLSFEYQQARPGSEDVISGNAYVNYTRMCSPKNTIYGALAYAGRDGSAKAGDTDMTHGGTGIQVSAGWEHVFNHRLAGKIELGGANRYFPIIMARLSATYNLPRQWQLSGFFSYRMLNSYSATYGWKSEEIGRDSYGNPIYGTPQYVRTGWNESKTSMFQLGVGASKTLGKFLLAGSVSGFMFSEKFYFNSNLKVQFFPKDGNSSHFFAVGGIGTAPESSLIDRSMPVGFDKLNTFVGMGGSYFLNRWLTLGLAGTWYTMLSQSERLTTSYVANDPYILEEYRNYFYLHASVTISF